MAKTAKSPRTSGAKSKRKPKTKSEAPAAALKALKAQVRSRIVRGDAITSDSTPNDLAAREIQLKIASLERRQVVADSPPRPKSRKRSTQKRAKLDQGGITQEISALKRKISSV